MLFRRTVRLFFLFLSVITLITVVLLLVQRKTKNKKNINVVEIELFPDFGIAKISLETTVDTPGVRSERSTPYVELNNKFSAT